MVWDGGRGWVFVKILLSTCPVCDIGRKSEMAGQV